MINALLLVTALTYNLTPISTLRVVEGWSDGHSYELHVVEVPARDTYEQKVLLEEDAAESFKEMMVAAAKDGHFLKVNFGFRDMKEQTYWYNKYNRLCRKAKRRGVENPVYCGLAAKPGHSTHQQGLSVDISGCSRTITWKDIEKHKHPEQYETSLLRKVDKGYCSSVSTGYRCRTILYWWLLKNAPRYGFKNTVEVEPWHWQKADEEIGVGG